MDHKIVIVEDSFFPAAKPKPRLWLEATVVFALAVLPANFSAIYYLARPSETTSFTWNAFHYLVVAIQESAVIFFIMRQSDRPWSAFGIVRPRFLEDLFWTVFVFFALIVITIGAALILAPDPLKERYSFYSSGERGWFPILLTYFSIAFAEELVMRGYFIPRLKDLLGSTWEAVLISSALFSSFHIYQGPHGIATSFLLGLVLGPAFCFIQRLWPLILAHALWDIMVHVIRLEN